MSDNQTMDTESWSDYRIFLIRTLERLEALIRELEKKIDDLRRDGSSEVARVRAELNDLKVDFAMQKVKVSIYGSLAGAGISALVSYLMRAH